MGSPRATSASGGWNHMPWRDQAPWIASCCVETIPCHQRTDCSVAVRTGPSPGQQLAQWSSHRRRCPWRPTQSQDQWSEWPNYEEASTEPGSSPGGAPCGLSREVTAGSWSPRVDLTEEREHSLSQLLQWSIRQEEFQEQGKLLCHRMSTAGKGQREGSQDCSAMDEDRPFLVRGLDLQVSCAQKNVALTMHASGMLWNPSENYPLWWCSLSKQASEICSHVTNTAI